MHFIRILSSCTAIVLSIVATVNSQDWLIPNYDDESAHAVFFDERDVNTPLILRCKPTVSRFKPQWAKNGKKLEEIDDLRGRYEINLPYNDILTIREPTFADAGNYSCFIKEGPFHRGAQIHVIANVYSKSLPQNIFVEVDEQLRIHCEVNGTNPKIKWTIGGNKSFDRNRIVLSNDSKLVKNSILTIANVDIKDANVYGCIARNKATRFKNYTEAKTHTVVIVTDNAFSTITIVCFVFMACAIPIFAILVFLKFYKCGELGTFPSRRRPEGNTENEEIPLSMINKMKNIVKDLDAVKKLVKTGININAKYENGQTMLQLSSELGHLEVTEYLIERGAYINDKDDDGKTALHCSSCDGHLEVTKYLIKKDANVNDKNYFGWTALHYSSSQGHLENTKYLIENGAKLNATDDDWRTALHLSSHNGHLEVTKYLIKCVFEKEGDICFYINAGDRNRRTALHHSSQNGHLEVIKYLIEQRIASIYVKDENGQTALHYSSHNGHLEVTKYLIKCGININYRDDLGRTALHLSSLYGHLEVTKSLIEKKAHIDVKDGNRQTALHYSSHNGQSEVTKYLIEKGADINAEDVDGKTALHHSCTKEHLQVTKYLVEGGANINAEDNDGKTALNYSLQREHWDIYFYLVRMKTRIKTH